MMWVIILCLSILWWLWTYVRAAPIPAIYRSKLIHHHWFLGSAPSLAYHARMGNLCNLYVGLARSHHWKTFAFSLPCQAGSIIYNVTSPLDVRHVLDNKSLKYHKGAQYRAVYEELLGQGIFNSDGDRWSIHRQIASRLFSHTKLHTHMCDVFRRKCNVLVDVIKSRSSHQESIDLQHLLFCFTFDSIIEIASGRTESRSLSVLQDHTNEESLRVQNAYDRAQQICSSRFFRPWWKLQRQLGMGEEHDLIDQLDEVNRYVYRLIDDHKALLDDDGGSDLLSLCPSSHSRAFLRDVVLNFLVAGRDTIAVACTWIIWETLQHPELMPTLLADVDRVDLEGQEPAAVLSAVGKLHYLEAFCLETLRVHPSVPINGYYATESDTLPSGLCVRPGDAVSFNPIIQNHNPSNWKDPHKFLPNRWLARPNEQVPAEIYPTFNGGRRACLGKTMALFEAKMVIVHLLKHFTFRAPRHFEPRTVTGTVLAMNKLLVHARCRYHQH